jgi:hypothetical protein
MLLAASLGREPRMDHVCTCRHLRVYLPYVYVMPSGNTWA